MVVVVADEPFDLVVGLLARVRRARRLARVSTLRLEGKVVAPRAQDRVVRAALNLMVLVRPKVDRRRRICPGMGEN